MAGETELLDRERAQRALAVLLAMGKPAAQAVLKHLQDVDLRKLAAGARHVRHTPETLMMALGEFASAMEAPSAPWQAADGVFRQWVSEALGPAAMEAATLHDLPRPPPSEEVLGPVATADTEALAMVLGREHPQTMALVLSALEPSRALAVVNKLPAALQSEVIMRMARVEVANPDLLKEVGQALAGELRAAAAGGVRKMDGKTVALEVLRNKPAAEQAELVKKLEEQDPELAAELRSKLFTFEDLIHLPDRDIQALLKEFDTKVLMVALKGASPAAANKVFKNMSSRAADMLKDDMSAMGPVRLADVEEAQGQLVAIVGKLAADGRIRLIGPADKMV